MTRLVPTAPEFLHLQGRRDAPGGLFFAGRRISWAELAGAVDDLADWLARRGVAAGQHVGVMAANEPALVAMLYALWGLGAVVVPIGVPATAHDGTPLLLPARASAPLPDPRPPAVARRPAAPARI